MATRLLSRDEARTFYDRMGRKLDLQRIFEDPAFDLLIRHGGFEHATSVVELACGTGRLARRLFEEHLSPTASYVGFDLSPRMCDIARERLAPWRDRAEVRRTDGSPGLPLCDGAADRFICTFMLDLLSEEEIGARLCEARRVLAPGGRLCLASLTSGRTLPSRLFSRIWTRIHSWNPRLVGGCRPLHLECFVSPGWNVLHQEVVCAFGFCSDVLIAA